MRAIKKPVTVECFVLGRSSFPDWFADRITDGTITTKFEKDGVEINSDSPFQDMSDYIVAYIETLEGTMKADNGDYIIKGVEGEMYPCKPDIFRKTYTILKDGDLWF